MLVDVIPAVNFLEQAKEWPGKCSTNVYQRVRSYGPWDGASPFKKIFKLLFSGKRQLLENSAKGLSECQCKFPFVFWIKMGISLSSTV